MTDLVGTAPLPRMPEYPNIVPPVDEQWRTYYDLVQQVLCPNGCGLPAHSAGAGRHKAKAHR